MQWTDFFPARAPSTSPAATWARAGRRWVGRLDTRALPLRALSLVIVGLVLLPLVYLVIRVLDGGVRTLAGLVDARTLVIAGNSLALVLAVTAAAAVIGTAFAWLTTRTNLPGRRIWLVIGLLPLVIPSYIGTMLLIEVFAPRGMLRDALAPLGVQSLPPIYGFFGAWLAITLFSYPYVVLPVRAALLRLDPSLEEAARAAGLRGWSVFMRVMLPALRPALGAGMLLTALYTLSDFGAVTLMRYDAFTRAIYLQYTGSFDRSRAALLALLLAGLALCLVILERRVARGSERLYRAGAGCQRKPRVRHLGRWTLPALIFCAVLVGVGVGAPAVGLLRWLMLAGANGGIQLAPLMQPTLNTITVSVVAALVMALLSLPPAWLAVRVGGRSSRWLVQALYVGNALPGLVIALALVFFTANAAPALYQTLPVLLFGYCVRFLPMTVGATRSALAHVSPRYEEAGRGLGLSAVGVLARITTPLARAGVMGGAALAFLNVMKELPTTLLLSPTGYNTLPMAIWQANDAARYTEAAAPTLLLLLVSGLGLALFLRGSGET